MLTSATRGETLTPNPNECNSTLTSVTRGTYPYPDTYIYKCSLVVWNLDKTLLDRLLLLKVPNIESNKLLHLLTYVITYVYFC